MAARLFTLQQQAACASLSFHGLDADQASGRQAAQTDYCCSSFSLLHTQSSFPLSLVQAVEHGVI
eukprot:4388679-Amphidinium_carterae.2